ncbi:MAG: hypothetical protein PHO10_12535, partial [Gemmiger sp.]|nr:hypothetical protein [Gemmiger sp.]
MKTTNHISRPHRLAAFCCAAALALAAAGCGAHSAYSSSSTALYETGAQASGSNGATADIAVE